MTKDPSDTIGGVSDICFPIFDHFGVVASLNIVYMQHRDVRVSIPAARELLRNTALGISRALGWLGEKHGAEAQRKEEREKRKGKSGSRTRAVSALFSFLFSLFSFLSSLFSRGYATTSTAALNK